MQDPYQNPQQLGYSVSAPAASPTTRGGGGRGRIIAIIAAVVVVAVGGLGFFRYNGPVDTVRGFVNDLFVGFNVQAAANRICSDSSDKITNVATLQQQFDLLKNTAKFDVSGVTYGITSQNFISDATVHVDGTAKITLSAGGQGQASSVPLKGDVKLKTSGLGWCIENSGGSLNPAAG